MADTWSGGDLHGVYDIQDKFDILGTFKVVDTVVGEADDIPLRGCPSELCFEPRADT
jgi:hypothetical protein